MSNGELDKQFELRLDAFTIPAEQALLTSYKAANDEMDGRVTTFVTALRGLVPVINNFFDALLVMDEDTAVRENRLALLQYIANLTKGMADLSYLEGF